jgi:hypothetical protein
MAKRLAIPSKELALTVVGPVNSYKAARIQRVGLDNTIPINDIDELGNSRHAGTTLGTATVTLTFQSMDVSTALFGVLTGVSGAYPVAGRDIQYLGEIDAILKVKDAITTQYAKTAHAKRLQIRDFTYNYTVDGEATEEYTAIGSEKRWFKWDVLVDKFTTGTNSFTLSYMPIQLKNGNKLLSVILDGGYLTEVSAGPTTGQYSVSGNVVTLADNRVNQVIFVYHANSGGADTWTDVSDTVNPAAIRGRDVNVFIGVNQIYRVQSVNINGNLRPEAVNELGSRVVIGYQRQVPTVEGQITVLDTDTELIELLTTGSVNVSGVVEYVVGDSPCVISGVSLEVKLVDPCDTSTPFTVLKTVYIPSITIAGDNFTSNVNGNAQQVFNWRSTDAQCIVYSGAKP